MKLRDAVALACSALRGGIVRTLLTILGMAVGVGAVLAVLVLGDSGETRVEDEIGKLGIDKIWIRAQDDDHTLTEEEAALAARIAHTEACAGAYAAGNVTLGGASALVQIAGYDSGVKAVHALKTVEGRGFAASDFADGAAVCIVDEALAERLGGDVVGKRLQCAGRLLKIVGVTEGMALQVASGADGMVILPLTTFLDTLGGGITEITLAVPRGVSASETADAVLAALSDDGGYRAVTLEDEIGAAREVVRIFVTVLKCVALVCMLTGGIGVMNVLLVSVRERRQEIGLIKAIGGTSAQVALLFLFEAAAYALLGGLLGVLLGAVMIRAFAEWIGLEAALTAGVTLPVLAAAALLGLICGVGPALSASSMQPVDALRSE